MTATVRLQREPFDAAAEAARAHARAHRHRRGRHLHRHLPRRRERRADRGPDARALSRTWRKPRSRATSRRRSSRWPLLGVTVIHRYGRHRAGRGHRAGGHRVVASAGRLRGRRIPDGLSQDPRAVLEAGRACRGGKNWVDAKSVRRCSAPTAGRSRRAGARRRNEAQPVRFRPAQPGKEEHHGPHSDRCCGAARLDRERAAGGAGDVLSAAARCLSRTTLRPAADGTVWISGQRHGFAGRFDPKTGKLEKIPLGPGAAPHGVIVGPDGAAWLTEGGQNAIARVDRRHQGGQALSAAGGISRAPISTPWCSTRPASSGSPARAAFMAASIPRAAKSTPGRRRAAAVPTASPSRRRARSGTPRSPATTSRMSTAHRRGDRGRAAAQGRRSAPHLVGLQGPPLGELLA